MYKNKGFTLAELMITLVIAAILTAMAVPASRTLQAKMRVNSATESLVSMLKVGRAEALTARRHTTVTSKNVSPPTNNNWGGSGWTVTELQNAVAVSISEQNALPATTTIQSIPTLAAFRFEGVTGVVQNANGTALAAGVLTFRVCDTGINSEVGKDVQINQFGRMFVRAHASAAVCNT